MNTLVKGNDGSITEYNERGNIEYSKNPNGLEVWKKYNENRCIHKIVKYKDGRIEEFNEDGNITYSKNSTGFENWWEYIGDKWIHTKETSGYQSWNVYDENRNILYHNDTCGFGYQCKYAENEDMIYRSYANGEIQVFKYDRHGRCIRKSTKLVDNVEQWEKRYYLGNYFHYKNSKGFKYMKEYDDIGNTIHYRDNKGVEYWHEYNKNGKLTYYKDFNNIEMLKDTGGDNIIYYKVNNKVLYDFRKNKGV